MGRRGLGKEEAVPGRASGKRLPTKNTTGFSGLKTTGKKEKR